MAVVDFQEVYAKVHCTLVELKRTLMRWVEKDAGKRVVQYSTVYYDIITYINSSRIAVLPIRIHSEALGAAAGEGKR